MMHAPPSSPPLSPFLVSCVQTLVRFLNVRSQASSPSPPATWQPGSFQPARVLGTFGDLPWGTRKVSVLLFSTFIFPKSTGIKKPSIS